MSEASDVRPEDALEIAQRALAEVNVLKQRVAELEVTDEEPSSETVDYDDRDSAVIEHLDPGAFVTVSELHRLYGGIPISAPTAR